MNWIKGGTSRARIRTKMVLKSLCKKNWRASEMALDMGCAYKGRSGKCQGSPKLRLTEVRVTVSPLDEALGDLKPLLAGAEFPNQRNVGGQKR